MRSFVIYLPTYRKSVEMASAVIESGRNHNWELELFEGVDGAVDGLADFKIDINQSNAKCRDMMSRPGVQGCFLSHWKLSNLCVELNEPIGIFEHDITILGSFPDVQVTSIFKLEGFYKKKPRPAGEWYEGARAYIIHQDAAKKLIEWVHQYGALPADVNIGLDVVDITLDESNCVEQHTLQEKSNKRKNSFTWNLKGMK